MFEKLKQWYEDWKEKRFNDELEFYFAMNGGRPNYPPRDEVKDRLNMVNQLYRLEEEKISSLEYINKYAYENGFISGEEYRKELTDILDKKREIMLKAVEENTKILNKAIGKNDD